MKSSKCFASRKLYFAEVVNIKKIEYNFIYLVVIGNWNGYGKWEGAVFGPTSKIINNECGGESQKQDDIGGYESRRIKGRMKIV